MAFSDNLLFIRHKHNLTQEDLADRLGVSRQTISKWESGACYPEMDKILTLCDLYDCSLEALMRGNLAKEAPPEQAPHQNDTVSDELLLKRTDRHFLRFALSIGIGVFLILAGVALCVFLDTFPACKAPVPIGALVLLALITASVVLFILSGINHTAFLKEYPTAPVYPAEQIKTFDKKFAAGIVIAVALIMGGVIMIVAVSGQTEEIVSRFTALFLLLIGVAVFLFVVSGILRSRFSAKEYNPNDKNSQAKEETKKAAPTDAERKIAIFSPVLFLIAVVVFLLLGFLGNYWHPAWVVFPVCGIITAIFSIIVKGGKD